MPPVETGFAIYQVPLSRTLIFSASSLYGFYSSAFSESLLLARKSLSENFRLWLLGSAAAVRLSKTLTGFLKHTFPVVKECKASRRRLISLDTSNNL